MVEGSLATATKASPMPTGRAPTPILRNVAADVPTRWPPSEVWARAAGAVAASAAATPSNARMRSLEVIVESQAPLCAGQVARRILKLADDPRRARLIARQLVQLFLREQALPRFIALAGEWIDAAGNVRVEDVGAA